MGVILLIDFGIDMFLDVVIRWIIYWYCKVLGFKELNDKL